MSETDKYQALADRVLGRVWDHYIHARDVRGVIAPLLAEEMRGLFGRLSASAELVLAEYAGRREEGLTLDVAFDGALADLRAALAEVSP